MSYYECVFIARQDLSQSQAEALTESYTQILSDNKGKLVSKEYWGLKGLAYPIKKNKRGHYMMMNVEAPSSAIQEMERQMRFNEDVIRYLSIKVDALEKGPSIMMKQQDRDFSGKDKFQGRSRDENRDTSERHHTVSEEDSHASK